MKFKHLAYPLIFGAFFIVGLAMGFSYTPAQGAPLTSQAKTYPSQSKTIKLYEQLNVLLIGVEEVGLAETRLKSIWLIMMPPSGNEITLMPIYPQPKNFPNEEYSKPHKPIWVDASSAESATIIRLLAEQDTWWDEVVLVDEIGMLTLLKLLGGADKYSEALSGVLASRGTPSTWKHPQAALKKQTALLKSVCELGATVASPRTFILPTSDHLVTSSHQVDLFAEMYKLSASITGFGCQFPALD